MKTLNLFSSLLLFIPLVSFAQKDPKNYVNEGFTETGVGVYFMDGKSGIVNEDGKILLADCDMIEEFIMENDYRAYYYHPYAQRHNIVFEKKGKYGVFNDTLGVIIKPTYKSAGFTDEERNIFWGQTKTRIVYMNIESRHKPGKPIDVLTAANIATDSNSFPVILDGLRNTICTDGKGTIIEDWDFVRDLDYSYGDGVVVVNGNNDWGVLDESTRRILVPLIYVNAGYYMRNDQLLSQYIYVQTVSGKYGAYDLEGNLLVDTAYTELTDFDPDLVVAVGKRDGITYLIDEHGKEVLKSNDDFSNISGTTLLIYGDDLGESLYDLRTHSTIAGPFRSIEPVGDDLLLIGNDTAFGVMDLSGSIIIQPVFDGIEGPYAGTFTVYHGDQNGLMDEEGKFIEPLSSLPWEMRTEQFDTLYYPNDIWLGDDHYMIDLGLNEDDGPSDAPKSCRIGKCYEANKNAARNFILYDFPASHENHENGFTRYHYFEPVYINNEDEEYYDDERWEIEHVTSFQSASRFSFSVKELVTADEGSAEDRIGYFNYYFPKDQWEEMDLASIIDFNKFPSALRDSIKARAAFRSADSNGEVEMQFDDDSLFFQNLMFYVYDGGITFITLNANNESLSQYIEFRVADSEFTWKELRPFLNKDFIPLLYHK